MGGAANPSKPAGISQTPSFGTASVGMGVSKPATPNDMMKGMGMKPIGDMSPKPMGTGTTQPADAKVAAGSAPAVQPTAPSAGSQAVGATNATSSVVAPIGSGMMNPMKAPASAAPKPGSSMIKP